MSEDKIPSVNDTLQSILDEPDYFVVDTEARAVSDEIVSQISDDEVFDNVSINDLNTTKTKNNKDESIPVAIKPKGRRGRPKKEVTSENKIDITPVAVATTDETTDVIDDKRIKKNKKSKIDIDELPLDIIDYIFKNFSTIPILQISEKTNIPQNIIRKVIAKLEMIFTMAITTGDLTEEKYNSYIKPFLVEFQEVDDQTNIEKFVSSVIS